MGWRWFVGFWEFRQRGRTKGQCAHITQTQTVFCFGKRSKNQQLIQTLSKSNWAAVWFSPTVQKEKEKRRHSYNEWGKNLDTELPSECVHSPDLTHWGSYTFSFCSWGSAKTTSPAARSGDHKRKSEYQHLNSQPFPIQPQNVTDSPLKGEKKKS